MKQTKARPTKFPPRGAGNEGEPEELPSAQWGHPWLLGPAWDFRPGKVLLGEWQGRLIGDPDHYATGGVGDDRHIFTVAGSRAGKTRTVLAPALRRYTGSAIVIDPKGELARKTARARRQLGQKIYRLDPFRTAGRQTHGFNPLKHLDERSPSFIYDVGLVVDAMVVEGEGDPHWTDSAKDLLVAVILYVFATRGPRTLVRVRGVLLGQMGPLSKDDDDSERPSLFAAMAGEKEVFGGLLQQLGLSFLDKSEREMSSIVSVARVQTRFLDGEPMRDVLEESSFDLADLKREDITVYLCLPALRLGTHSRWMRVILNLALAALESDQTVPKVPVLLLLEEFASLSRMQSIERAAGLMAGLGVRLWTVLQDLSQLKRIYKDSWETFIGNAGIIQAFATFDLTTTQYLSDLLGKTEMVQVQKVWTSVAQVQSGDSGEREHFKSVNLLDPTEITRHFARETERQLVLVPGRPPLYLDRFDSTGDLEQEDDDVSL